MFYLLLILGLLSMGIGVFLAGFSVPIRETTFGAALLVAGSVGITGGFVVIGLAAAVAELQLVVRTLRARMPGLPRAVRPAEKPRIAPPPRSPAESPPPPVPETAEAPAAPEPEAPPRRERPEWLRRAMADLESASRKAGIAPAPSDQPAPSIAPQAQAQEPVSEAPPERPRPEPRLPPAQSFFDKVWPPERRRFSDDTPERDEAEPIRGADERPRERPDERGAGQRSAEAKPWPAEPRPGEPRPTEGGPAELHPSIAPPEASPPPAARGAEKPPPAQEQPAILKSGVIDEMAYTLFADGSIEAQLPDGTMRFASIEELRRHIEQQDR